MTLTPLGLDLEAMEARCNCRKNHVQISGTDHFIGCDIQTLVQEVRRLREAQLKLIRCQTPHDIIVVDTPQELEPFMRVQAEQTCGHPHLVVVAGSAEYDAQVTKLNQQLTACREALRTYGEH